MDSVIQRYMVIILCCGVIQWANTYDIALEEELREWLFITNKYNRQIRPNGSVQVSMAMALYNLKKLDITTESLEAAMYFPSTWIDSRLNWSNNKTFSSIRKIEVKEKDVWMPKITIANSKQRLSVMSDENIVLSVFVNGLVSWTPGALDETYCECRTTYYPFDTQTCEVRITTWGTILEELQLQFQPDPLSLAFYNKNGEWEYMGYATETVDKNFTAYSLRHLSFYLSFRRRPLFKFLNVLLPITLLSVLTCMIFKVHAASGEKMGFCLTVLLAFALYLTMVTDHIPSTSLDIPYFSIYLFLMLAICVLSVIATIFVLHCHHEDSNKPVPDWLKYITRNFLFRLSCRIKCSKPCCTQRRRQKVEDSVVADGEKKRPDKHPDDNTPDGKDPELSWHNIGLIFDSIGFVISCLVTAVITIVTYSALIYGYVEQPYRKRTLDAYLYSVEKKVQLS